MHQHQIEIGEPVAIITVSEEAAAGLQSSLIRQNLFDTSSMPHRFPHDGADYESLQFEFDLTEDVGDSCPARGSGVSQEMMFRSVSRSPLPLPATANKDGVCLLKSSPSIKL